MGVTGTVLTVHMWAQYYTLGQEAEKWFGAQSSPPCLRHGHEQKTPTQDWLLVPEQSRYLTMLFSRFSPSFSFTGSISQDLWLWQIWKSVRWCYTRWEDRPERLPGEAGLLEAAPTVDTGLRAQSSISRLGCTAAALRTSFDPMQPQRIPQSSMRPQGTPHSRRLPLLHRMLGETNEARMHSLLSSSGHGDFLETVYS